MNCCTEHIGCQHRPALPHPRPVPARLLPHARLPAPHAVRAAAALLPLLRQRGGAAAGQGRAAHRREPGGQQKGACAGASLPALPASGPTAPARPGRQPACAGLASPVRQPVEPHAHSCRRPVQLQQLQRVPTLMGSLPPRLPAARPCTSRPPCPLPPPLPHLGSALPCPLPPSPPLPGAGACAQDHL